MKKTILLIEDDCDIVEIYSLALTNGGFEVKPAETGERAFEILEQDPRPNLVLLDLILPDMNGIKILEKIRKDTDTAGIPVFILTNYADKELEKMGYNLKSEQHLLKANMTPTQLVEIVKKRLGKN